MKNNKFPIIVSTTLAVFITLIIFMTIKGSYYFTFTNVLVILIASFFGSIFGNRLGRYFTK